MKRLLHLVGLMFVSGLVMPGCEKKERGEPKVEMKSATLKEIETDIARHKGKIVVVDLWSFLCNPCKDEFPNLVRLHHELGDKGVVASSICLTMRDANAEKPKAEEFLKEKKAVTTNFWVTDEEGYAKAAARWKFEGIPVVVIYGRDGAIAKTFTNDDPDSQFTYADVEKYLGKMLAK